MLGFRVLGCVIPLAFASGSLFAQQVADSTYDVSVEKPAYRPGTGPVVSIVEEWVKGGGNLLLIADHAPMGVAAEILARRFGVGMSKGYTEDSTSHFNIGGFGTSVLLYSRASGLLKDHPITRGLDSVVAFTGQSLSGPENAEPLLVLSPGAFDHPSPTAEQAARGSPGTAWRTSVIGLPTTPATGRAQGLAIRVGKGRVVVLGEAAMLSAQAVFNAQGDRLGIAGMNVPGIGNRQFALNVMHWLSGRL